MEENKKLPRILIVGIGKMGANHLRVVGGEKALQLVGVVEPKISFDLPTGVMHYKTLEEADASTFDAAIVATPTETHYEVAKKLLLLKKKSFSGKTPGQHGRTRK